MAGVFSDGRLWEEGVMGQYIAYIVGETVGYLLQAACVIVAVRWAIKKFKTRRRRIAWK